MQTTRRGGTHRPCGRNPAFHRDQGGDVLGVGLAGGCSARSRGACRASRGL